MARYRRRVKKVEYGSHLNVVRTRDLDRVESAKNSLTGFIANFREKPEQQISPLSNALRGFFVGNFLSEANGL